ncbi:hypothetical protein TNCT1_62090 [Streptomyces sp. 1-11]|nr:hypothetical protein TNCT1_62090 [Streptomyces sp. 1-11]
MTSRPLEDTQRLAGTAADYATVRAGGRTDRVRPRDARGPALGVHTAPARFHMDRDLHPLGFVVPDSLVVTYRDPEPDDIDDVELTSTVVDRFYVRHCPAVPAGVGCGCCSASLSPPGVPLTTAGPSVG